MAKNYLKSVCSEDISRIDGVQRDEKTAAMIMRSYARNISTVAKKTSMLSDVTSSGEVSCSSDTFDDYVKALEKLFVIQDIGAWCPAIRSKSNIRSTPKRSFCDPSVAVAALGLSPDILMTQLKTFGFCSSKCVCVTFVPTRWIRIVTFPTIGTGTALRRTSYCICRTDAMP